MKGWTLSPDYRDVLPVLAREIHGYYLPAMPTRPNQLSSTYSDNKTHRHHPPPVGRQRRRAVAHGRAGPGRDPEGWRYGAAGRRRPTLRRFLGPARRPFLTVTSPFFRRPRRDELCWDLRKRSRRDSRRAGTSSGHGEPCLVLTSVTGCTLPGHGGTAGSLATGEGPCRGCCEVTDLAEERHEFRLLGTLPRARSVKDGGRAACGGQGPASSRRTRMARETGTTAAAARGRETSCRTGQGNGQLAGKRQGPRERARALGSGPRPGAPPCGEAASRRRAGRLPRADSRGPAAEAASRSPPSTRPAVPRAAAAPIAAAASGAATGPSSGPWCCRGAGARQERGQAGRNRPSAAVRGTSPQATQRLLRPVTGAGRVAPGGPRVWQGLVLAFAWCLGLPGARMCRRVARRTGTEPGRRPAGAGTSPRRIRGPTPRTDTVSTQLRHAAGANLAWLRARPHCPPHRLLPQQAFGSATPSRRQQAPVQQAPASSTSQSPAVQQNLSGQEPPCPGRRDWPSGYKQMPTHSRGPPARSAVGGRLSRGLCSPVMSSSRERPATRGYSAISGRRFSSEPGAFFSS